MACCNLPAKTLLTKRFCRALHAFPVYLCLLNFLLAEIYINLTPGRPKNLAPVANVTFEINKHFI